MGFSRVSMINRKAIIEAIEKHYGKDALARIDSAYRLNKNQQWFRLAGEASVFDVPLPRHLALSHFLFGSASAFWEFAAKTALQTPVHEASTKLIAILETPNTSSATTPLSGTNRTLPEFASEWKKSRVRLETI